MDWLILSSTADGSNPRTRSAGRLDPRPSLASFIIAHEHLQAALHGRSVSSEPLNSLPRFHGLPPSVESNRGVSSSSLPCFRGELQSAAMVSVRCSICVFPLLYLELSTTILSSQPRRISSPPPSSSPPRFTPSSS